MWLPRSNYRAEHGKHLELQTGRFILPVFFFGEKYPPLSLPRRNIFYKNKINHLFLIDNYIHFA
ncbi:hypothetical protein TH468_06690 [Thalassospira sp. MCCC 1A03138]|nr:hypothetical protein TH468_06690 [Thalassospira sp. MCCC 1A03138]